MTRFNDFLLMRVILVALCGRLVARRPTFRFVRRRFFIFFAESNGDVSEVNRPSAQYSFRHVQ